MLIYGWNTKIIKEGEAPNMQCNACDHEGQLVGISASYAHLFWIPFFPYKKSAVVVCPNCGQTTEAQHLPEELKRPINELKKSVSFPKYMFIGLALLIGLIGYGTFASMQSDNAKVEAIADPTIGDVYNTIDLNETSEYKYSYLKVTNLKGDSVEVIPTVTAYNMKSDELLEDDYFIRLPSMMHKDELMKMYEAGEIVELYRVYDASSGFTRESEMTEELLRELFPNLEESVAPEE